MKTWSFYSEDGSVLPDRYCGPPALLMLNTPAGCIAIEGDLDPQRHRVQLVDDGMGGEAVPVIVDRLPPRPDREVAGAEWDWDDDAADWVLVPTLDGLRASRWAALRERRNALEVAPLLVDGMLFDCDERAVARIGLALKQAELTPGWAKAWTLADNTTAPITAPVLMRVLLALATRGEKLHATGRALRERIAEATTAAQIEAVTWPEETINAYA
ncbi:MAG: hypothetical protein RL654_97 [Pseudomonadota bacterium]|jgi:hypothetical protein